MENSKLTSLTGEDFDAAFGWIDWRGSEQEVVDIVQSQLADDWTLQLTDDDEHTLLSIQGTDHIIPLTGTSSDRYVMLSSLAEIMKETQDDARADWRARINADAEKFLDRYAAQEEAANRKSLIGWFGFPVVIAILALIAGLIAIAPN